MDVFKRFTCNTFIKASFQLVEFVYGQFQYDKNAILKIKKYLIFSMTEEDLVDLQSACRASTLHFQCFIPGCSQIYLVASGRKMCYISRAFLKMYHSRRIEIYLFYPDNQKDVILIFIFKYRTWCAQNLAFIYRE